MKTILFSRYFPAKHPKKGQRTYFVEKMLAGLDDKKLAWTSILGISDFVNKDIFVECDNPKWHTIRPGERFKEGDFFIPRIWTGAPYRSKQFQFAPPIMVEKIFNFQLFPTHEIYINGKFFGSFGSENIEMLARNDGLGHDDFRDWFLLHPFLKSGHFAGQILCWDKNITYE